MIKVEVQYHKDGDHLVVIDVPWWTDIYEGIVDKFCPCCGFTGWISSKSERAEAIFHRIWNRLLNVTFTNSKELFKIPVENGCVASQAIWPKTYTTCFRDGCENCWDRQDDAFQYITE